MADGIEPTTGTEGADFLSGAILSAHLSERDGLEVQGDLEDKVKELEDKLNKIAEIINPSAAAESESSASSDGEESDTSDCPFTGFRCD